MPTTLYKATIGNKELELKEYSDRLTLSVKTDKYKKMIVISSEDVMVFNEIKSKGEQYE